MISLKNLSDFRSSHLALNIQRCHFSHVRLASNGRSRGRWLVLESTFQVKIYVKIEAFP